MVRNSDGHGIVTSNYCKLIGNNVSYSGLKGVMVGDGSVLRSNTVSSNRHEGIETGTYCVIEGNTVLDNSRDPSGTHANLTYGGGCQVQMNVAP